MPKRSNAKPRSPLRHRFARLVAGLALLTVLAIWGVQEAWGESHWFTVYLTYAPPLLYVAMPAAALLVGLLCRDGRALAWAALAVAVWVGALARPSLHPPSRKPASAETFRVMTWNIHNDLLDIDDIGAQIAAADPDIVCLQEANAPRFREAWLGADSAQTDSGVILTRGRLLSSRQIKVKGEGHYLRRLLEAKVELDGHRLNVLNVHLYSYQLAAALRNPSREQARELTEGAVEMRKLQLAQMTEWLEAQRGPAVVAGDLNTPPRGKLYGRLAATATDAFAASGWGLGWTFPRKHPIIRIDYIWTTHDLRPVHCERLNVGPSDHLPVIADIALR